MCALRCLVFRPRSLRTYTGRVVGTDYVPGSDFSRVVIESGSRGTDFAPSAPGILLAGQGQVNAVSPSALSFSDEISGISTLLSYNRPYRLYTVFVLNDASFREVSAPSGTDFFVSGTPCCRS